MAYQQPQMIPMISQAQQQIFFPIQQNGMDAQQIYYGMNPAILQQQIKVEPMAA